MNIHPQFHANPIAGYYGKIPLAGDFVTRRIPHSTISVWDNWLRHGLYEVRNTSSPDSSARFSHLTVWNFVIPPAICGEQLIGMIGASSDRVGRQFPFTLFASLPPHTDRQMQLDCITPFFMRHGPIVRALQLRQLGLEQLEQALAAASDWQPAASPSSATPSIDGDIFSVLDDAEITVTPSGGLLPWPGLSLTEIILGNTSYWWTNQAAGGPLRAFTHTGGLNEPLFRILFFHDG